MNQEQFGQFWEQLKTPLKDTWVKITDADLQEIEGDLMRFSSVLHNRYGEMKKDEMNTWANRRYSHSGSGTEGIGGRGRPMFERKRLCEESLSIRAMSSSASVTRRFSVSGS